jgi:adenine phosphoribosyltransferase
MIGTNDLEFRAAWQNFSVEPGAHHLASVNADHAPRTADHRGSGNAHNQIGNVLQKRRRGSKHRLTIRAYCRIETPSMNHLKGLIREVPDFPKPGILFYDITTLLKDAKGLKSVIDGLSANYHGQGIDTVVGIEARGFIFAPAVAYALGAGFVPVRKPGKLPAAAERVEYQLEYGTDILEVHRDAVEIGSRVLIVDDVLATGGTAAAVVKLVRQLKGDVVGLQFVIELDFLKGREKLPELDVQALVHY